MNETSDFESVDRRGWPPGPWDDEPDRIEWIDEVTGQPCLMRRNGSGAWCGYTAVNPGHPLHCIDYMDVYYDNFDPMLDVHGGLTYSGACSGEICHVPQPGEPDDVWWFGFDCNHGYDLAPRLASFEMESLNRLSEMFRDDGNAPTVQYRDVEYVKAQTEGLARQLAEIK